MEYIALDLETTGVDPKKDKILEIGAAHVRDGVILDRFTAFVNPGRAVPEFITQLTGITDEMVADAPDERQAVRDFLDFGGELPILGHNILFDYSFLKSSAAAQKLNYQRDGIDTCRIARKFMAEPKSKSLEALCNYYGIDRERCHRAYDDAVAASRLYDCLLRDYHEVSPAAFEPGALYYKVKKDSPITSAQMRYLTDLIKRYGIKPEASVTELTKSEASRMIDAIIREHGRR